MTTYNVYLHGFNAANNPSRGARSPDLLVGTVEAESAEGACGLVDVTVYNGQNIYAVESDAQKAEEVAKGKWRVEYWRGTSAITEYCRTEAEVVGALDQHSNAYPPHVYETDTGDEVDVSGFYQTDDE